MLLAFTDLETTGLDKDKGSILELGIVLTDENLKVVGFYQQNMSPLPGYEDDFTALDPVVIDMHTANGLFNEIRQGICVRRYQAELDAIDWLKSFGNQKLMMAGNSVYWDRFWLKDHMPRLDACFIRHIIDITSLNRACELFNKELFERRPKEEKGSKHRALSDAQHSLAVLEYYRDSGTFQPNPVYDKFLFDDAPYASYEVKE